MLVILITHEEEPSFSLAPLSRRPRNAVVTKNMGNVLMEYRSAQDDGDSLSKSARPSVLMSACSGADGSLKNCETGPVWPALDQKISGRVIQK
jgi:hypothetical protein